ncbi:ComEA family DNA-binding protein [Streptomyces sp. NPDC005476]|uniref:ComEA family DNA-binding protein n=1 Tax=Streptomyces sp. NPDC005476 TaxID=3156882 RepID=UPI003456468A
MALRSRSRSRNATSGPGRAPGSDGRSSPRLRRPGGGRPGHRHASAEEIRRRAKMLFAEQPQDAAEMGMGPPDAPKTPDAPHAGVAGEESERHLRADGHTNADVEPDADACLDAEAVADSHGGHGIDGGGKGDTARRRVPSGREAWRERVGFALRERMPVWVQARCGLERRNVLALTVLLVVAAGFAVQHFWVGRVQPVRAPQVVRAAAPYDAGAMNPAVGSGTSAGQQRAGGTAGAEIVVDVSGKVRKPGIHRLPAGSRVIDALGAAGGVRPGTDTDGLNRARFLVDGEQVVVGGPAPQAGAAGTGTGSQAAGPHGPGAGGGPPVPVSLNTATVDQLDTLPGVGPVLAQHIVDHRAQHGGFRSVDELREVDGIGERRFADLRNLVRP